MPPPDVFRCARDVRACVVVSWPLGASFSLEATHMSGLDPGLTSSSEANLTVLDDVATRAKNPQVGGALDLMWRKENSQQTLHLSDPIYLCANTEGDSLRLTALSLIQFTIRGDLRFRSQFWRFAKLLIFGCFGT